MVKERNSSDKVCSTLSYPTNTVNILKVGNRLVFVHDSKVNSFQAKLTLENQSSRFVTYVVRSSLAEKFKIKPRYGFIHPRKALEVTVMTKGVDKFEEIGNEFFGVFAVPIYDKRQLEKKKLSLLWRAHGSDLFPLEAAEFHKVPYLLPKYDAYYSELNLVSRLAAMSFISRRKPCTPAAFKNEDKPVDDETFHLNWPNEGPITEDKSMEPIVFDWRQVTKKIQTETQAIQQNATVILATLITAGTTFLATSYLYLSDAVPFCGIGSDTTNTPEVPIVPDPKHSWLSGWKLNFWNTEIL